MASSRKAQTGLEIILVIVVLVAFAMIVVFGNKVLSEVNDVVQASDDMNNESKAFIGTVEANYPSTFDTAFLLVLIFLWLLLLVSSFLIDTHPVFFVVTIVLLIVAFVIAMVISNSYVEFAGDAEISSFASEFPMMSWIMENLLIVIMVIGFTSGVALYAKNQI